MAAVVFFFFFNDTATTEIYTLSLHDALPISARAPAGRGRRAGLGVGAGDAGRDPRRRGPGPQQPGAGFAGRRRAVLGRSEEHTSELQSRQYLVCRLLLEKKKKKTIKI